MTAPSNPKIYHIVHVDRLPSIIESGGLLCDAQMTKYSSKGTTIGMKHLKEMRLKRPLRSHSDLLVGDCVPFYFCPRSIMLFMISVKSQSLSYRGGQEPIVHLEADLRQTVAWAEKNNLRWAFTLSNASSRIFQDRCDLNQLNDIDWDAVRATRWTEKKVGKQAEFLIEQRFPWELVSCIGVLSNRIYSEASVARNAAQHRPPVEIKPKWYY